MNLISINVMNYAKTMHTTISRHLVFFFLAQRHLVLISYSNQRAFDLFIGLVVTADISPLPEIFIYNQYGDIAVDDIMLRHSYVALLSKSNTYKFARPVALSTNES